MKTVSTQEAGQNGKESQQEKTKITIQKTQREAEHQIRNRTTKRPSDRNTIKSHILQ